ncbi:MAG: FKBP-type peptidyl-prolyl cis-trans isomerase [Legionellaceae bacterium]|nr:FKBP-type peptidyl-prolyl cis-trans isomerase [Legionellaceae bacterium]
MKMKLVAAAVIGLAMSTTCAATDAIPLDTDIQKLSYSIGVDLGKNIKKQGIEIDVPSMSKGIQDALADAQLQMTDDQMKETLVKFQKDLMAKRTAQFEKKADDNKAKGDAFLKDNILKEGVVALASGLQYKVVTSGTGAKPTKDDTVTVEYTGRLINGDVFDSTDKAGKPATFQLSQVIPGWTEALQLMPVGSTWELYVPASLAYGSRNVGGLIGPNETLIFTVHLISIDKNANAAVTKKQ